MKKMILAITAFIFSHVLIAQDFELFNKSFEDLADSLRPITTENTTLLSTQPDAFIGRFFPSLPPRFYAGIVSSATKIDTKFIADDFELMIHDIVNQIPIDYAPQIKFSIPKSIFLPTAAASLRCGGFFLPFDFGVYAITTTDDLIKDISFDDFSMDMSISTIGGNFRYAILEGGNLLPKVSVGLEYIYTKYKMEIEMDKTLFSSEYGSGKILSDMSLTMESHTFCLDSQVSKKILFLTPFLGLKIYGSAYNTDLSWKIQSGGLFSDFYKTKEKSESKVVAYTPQALVYTGCGIQFVHFQLGLNCAYNFASNNPSASITMGFKI